MLLITLPRMSWFIRYSYHQLIFSVCSFQGTLLTDFSSVIRNLNIFRPLITGETSFHSTALLIGLARRIVVRPCLYLFLTSAAVLPPFFFFLIGGHLLSHTVSSAVPSAVQVLTIVFGMGTGVAPERIATNRFELLDNSTIDNSSLLLLPF